MLLRVPTVRSCLLLTCFVATRASAQDLGADAPPSVEPAPVECETGLLGDWGGVRADLADRGITFGLYATFQANRVLRGGLGHGLTAQALYDLNATFDLARLVGIPDATVFVDAYRIDGHNPSQDVGDVQSFSDLSGPRRVTQVAEAYYEQWFLDRTARIKFGKLDAAGDFTSPAAAGDGLHSASAWSPTNYTLPSYPNPAGGVVVGWSPSEDWAFKLGVFDGAGWTGVNTGSRWPKTFLGKPSDLFCIGQAERRWAIGDTHQAGGVSFGAWHHTGEFERASGGTEDSAQGYFAALDQELDHDDLDGHPTSTLAVLQVGVADGEIAPFELHVGGGVCWKGIRGLRPDDSLGFYASWLSFGDDPAFTESAETAIELYYRLSVCQDVVVRPDLQYIVNPGGDASVDDATVFSVRLELNL